MWLWYSLILFVAVDVGDIVGWIIVVVGFIDVRLGATIVVAVTVGIGVAFPQAANCTPARIMVDNINIRFDMVIDNSISNSKQYDNWLKDKFSLQAQLIGKDY